MEQHMSHSILIKNAAAVQNDLQDMVSVLQFCRNSDPKNAQKITSTLVLKSHFFDDIKTDAAKNERNELENTRCFWNYHVLC